MFALLNSPDRAVRTAAYGALAGVTTPADFNRLCGLLNQAQEDDVKALQAGLKNALAKESPDMQYKMVAGQMAAAPRKGPLLSPAGAGRQQRGDRRPAGRRRPPGRIRGPADGSKPRDGRRVV